MCHFVGLLSHLDILKLCDKLITRFCNDFVRGKGLWDILLMSTCKSCISLRDGG